MNDDKNTSVEGEVVGIATYSRVVEKLTIEDVMEDNFLRYSMSVIIDRALPDVRDGLKPVHRRILYSMGEQGLRPGGKFTKSARIVGDVMGKYHPHGDTAIYDSMVRLAQNWTMRYTLVNGQGNFGSMDGDPAAASRYTEARLDKAGNELLTDLDKETVDFRDNYDGSEKEPVVLPAKLPNLLLNGQIGIAVGMATSIPPHNLGELVDAIVYMIDNPEATTLDDLLKYVKGPDFPTGAVVYGGAPMRQAYQTGRGSVVIRAVANIEETKKGRSQIVVTEMPFAVNKATLIERIAELVKDKKITAISDLRDESARGSVRVVIELKKDSYPKKVLNQLYKLTSLQTSFHFNMLALIDGIQPRILGLEEILSEFIKHRQIVVRRRTEFELRKAKERAHILEGYKIALDHIDEVIKTIRASRTTDDAEIALIEKFNLSSIQAKAILAMQLRRLTGLEREAIENELKELAELIAKLEAILADEKEVLRIIKEELLEMKEKYGDPRRSKMINHELGKFSDEELIPEEDSVILLTTENYIKRTLVSEYHRQHRGGKGKRGMTTKEEDIIDQLIPASTHDYLLFFTNRGRIFRLKAYEVPAAGLQAKGVAAVNLLQLQPEEKITSIICHPKDAKDNGYLFMATMKGTIKKTPFEDYANIRTNGLIAIKLDEGDELRWIQKTTGENDVIISTSAGQAIRFNEKDARPMGRSARGVRGVRLRPNDQVVGMDIVDDDSRKLLVISENGYGKATKVSNFPSHKRGGVGIKAAVVTTKTGPIIAVHTLEPDASEVLLISNDGQAIRIALKDIPTLGRTTQGVRIMRMCEGDKVSSIGLMPAKESDEEGGEE
ncbi:DNA gyrase subunit A [Candidatus Saccharibacteria bacterium CG11_big_fil_rev_8_21_14_0_20_41_19]|nr:DNA gyrase subunit A [Candidatus Saccharibacteria bacterium]PIQ70576.1 MAG: DNA gyrase subunit A [Candidatus Saccharibacteria bacterium CG11_big_fil_rev_8_21_14_0_20_41_19]PIZ59485.1 MAG: DNA gyrase subunit A [Candidatus Saccharibacteria bacterium CG_4_10_14_0_2_um_filter_41_11]PJC29369.1 MAG: DNA gyrase subunit A [Candidatus Saccharibacteria bacterium CG_4_9_14_0_2_um_filter_41_9]PJE66362.1 MAG: DNA gyrase subunit A [Candidatus Saccharibacteria bacterium CG10_big_fil_rev_8_21_14_0_10_41_32]